MFIISIIIIFTIQSLYSNTVDNRYFFRLIGISLIFCSIIVYNCINTYDKDFIVTLYNGTFIVNNTVLIIQTYIYIISAIICFTWNYNVYDKDNNKFSNNIIREHFILVIFIIFGAIILIASYSLISIFICLELQSLSLYVLSTIYRYNNKSTESGIKYLILGSFSSCIILLSTGIIYSYIGSFNFSDIYQLIAYNNDYIIYIAFILIFVGIIFKVSAAPIHNWSPDVYDGTPTNITIWLTVLPKISLFSVLYTILNIITGRWIIIIIFIAIISLIIGSVLGCTQNKIKRIIAYSTINHVGFILICIYINTIEAYTAYIFYLIQYIISNFSVFSIILAIGYNINNDKDVEYINELSGLSKSNIISSIGFAITLISIAGVPPIVGFYAKIQVLYTIIGNKHYIISIISVITSVISTYYYINIVSTIYFNKRHTANFNSKIVNIVHCITISISIIYIVINVFYPEFLLDTITILAININNYKLNYKNNKIKMTYFSNITIILYILLVPIVVIILLLITTLFAPYSPDSEKVSIYESGIISVGETRSQFPISYYVVAILFIIFDIEVIIIFPFALSINTTEYIGFWIIIIFLIILTLGFVFELGSGALQFTSHRSKDIKLLFLI